MGLDHYASQPFNYWLGPILASALLCISCSLDIHVLYTLGALAGFPSQRWSSFSHFSAGRVSQDFIQRGGRGHPGIPLRLHSRIFKFTSLLGPQIHKCFGHMQCLSMPTPIDIQHNELLRSTYAHNIQWNSSILDTFRTKKVTCLEGCPHFRG